MHSVSGAWEEYSFQPRWRCCWERIWLARASGQALGQKQLQLVAEPLPPMAQVRALMREGMLEELFPGEVLEIRIIDPAFAHAFVG